MAVNGGFLDNEEADEMSEENEKSADDEESQSEEHPADALIGAKWRPPRRVQMENAWERLEPSKRERFTQLQREGWKDEPRLDRIEGEPEDSAWIEYELLPPDPRAAQPERIGRWPVKLEIDENNRVRSILDEFPD